MGAERTNDGADRALAVLAARQHGVVSIDQLEGLGIRRRGRERRLRAHRLHRVHRGVYAVGHAGLNREGIWMAAVLACGPNAVLSHGSAAALWGLLPSPSLSHVTVPSPGTRRQRKGLRVHHTTRLTAVDVTRRRGIPVTTPSRTLRDLRRTAPAKTFARALREAEYLGLTVGELEPDHTRSELEARFLALLRRHRLPKPYVNVRIGGYTVDFAWPQERLVVELDGYRAHRTRSAFESDRARDVALKLRGYEVIRLTWRQIAAESKGTADLIRRLLGRHQLGLSA